MKTFLVYIDETAITIGMLRLLSANWYVIIGIKFQLGPDRILLVLDLILVACKIFNRFTKFRNYKMKYVAVRWHDLKWYQIFVAWLN